MSGDTGRMRPAEVVRRASGYLERHGVESPSSSAEQLLMRALGTDRAGLYARSTGLSTREARWFGRALCRRGKGVPLQHLTGEAGFMGLTLRVEPGVFIPRPETEALVQTALELLAAIPDPVVVDVGTGTGAVALAIRDRRPDARLMALDASAQAAALARENALRLGLQIEVSVGDLLGPLPAGLRRTVDLVLSNPPYVEPAAHASLPPEVRADPYDALVGGTDLHARLSREAPGWLRPGGWLVMEIGDDQGPAVSELLRAGGFEAVDVVPDLAGRDRVARGRLGG